MYCVNCFRLKYMYHVFVICTAEKWCIASSYTNTYVFTVSSTISNCNHVKFCFAQNVLR